MITSRQEKDFQFEVLGTLSLSSVVDWIQNNLSPEDVFDEKDLKGWASNLSPEDLCDEKDLEQWALDNDFIKFY
jgi:hypothetical protein